MGSDQASARGGRSASVVAMTGGGTAGHVFPGVAVAEQLDCRVFWIGSTTGVEGRIVREAGIEFRGIPAGKLRRYLSLRNLTDVARVIGGVFASVGILLKEKPSLLFSKGGFVSVPPVLAARLCGIPSFTHESDFDPGLATRINLRFAEKVFVSFPDTVGFFPPRYRGKVVVSGNPVRSALLRGDAGRGRKAVGCEPGAPLLLVMGGSLGSSFINALVTAALPRLCARFFVVHQMGEREYRPSRDARYYTAAFLTDSLPDILAASDLVICRSGANTLAELAALGKPSVLIPFESGSRGDQIRNAEVFRSRGAAVVLREKEATPAALVSTVDALFDDPSRRSRLVEGARSLAGGTPAREIARMIRERIA